jgi:NAD(P)H-nitrite reductase large subunit
MDAPNVHTCWTLEDARAIAKLAKSGTRVLQIGAGFIGCIIMEALASRGTQLTVVEMGDRMVPRMMTEKAGNMIRRWCESKGVGVHTGAKVESLRAGAKKGELVAKLSNGQEVPGRPRHLRSRGGAQHRFPQGQRHRRRARHPRRRRMQTSVAGIYAAGDVTEAADFFSGSRRSTPSSPTPPTRRASPPSTWPAARRRCPAAGHQRARHPRPDLGLLRPVVGRAWRRVGGAGG